MIEFFSVVRADLRRSTFSFNFVFAITATLVSLWMISSQLNAKGSTLVSLIRNIFFSDYLLIFYPIAAIAYSSSFCIEWDNNFIKNILIRTSISKYSFSKIIACFVSAFLSIAIGCIMFLLIHSISTPITNPTEISQAAQGLLGPFETLIGAGHYLTYFSIKITISSAYFALYAVAALYVSTYITNVFVVYATPLILHYLIVNLSKVIGLPDFLVFSGLVHGVFDAGGLLNSLVYSLSFPIVLSLLIGFHFKSRIGRRLENG